MIGVGSAIPVSILLGKKNQKANNYFSCVSLMITITGLLMGILLFFTSPFFMRLIGAEGEFARLGVNYLRVYAVFSPFITMIFALDNYLHISGKIKTSMVLNIVMSLGTVLLELLFICTIIGVSFFLKGNLQLKYTKPQFDTELIKEIIKNGSPTFLTNISGRIFSIVMNIMLLKMGGESTVAIYGVLDSLQPAIGYNFGAMKYDRVKTIQKYCLITSAFISIVFAIVISLFPVPFAIPFLEDMILLTMIKHALRLFCIAYLFKWISHAIQSFLLAIDNAIPAMLISISTAFSFPLIIILVLLPLKLNGLWLNYTFTSILGAILSVIIILNLKNKLFIVKEDKIQIKEKLALVE